jgi:hypothetical protein
MTKNITFIILFLLHFTAFSQEVTKPKYETGITFGINSPAFLNDYAIDYLIPKDFRVRPLVGAFARYYLTNRLFADYQIAYSGEGGGFSNRKTNLDYLKNQLTFAYTTKHHRKNVFYFGINYNANFLLSAKYIDKINGAKYNIIQYYKRFYQGFGFSFGLKKRIGNTDFLQFNFVNQIFSSDLNLAEHHTSRQLLFPAFQISYSRQIK